MSAATSHPAPGGPPIATTRRLPALPATLGDGALVHADIAVVGAGVGGLVTALDLVDADPSRTVVVIDKGRAGTSGSTPLAQGGMAAAVGAGDSAAAHAADTIAAGDGLADPDAAAVLAAEAPGRVADLTRRGVIFDSDAHGHHHLAQEGGQHHARSVHVADHTGAAIFAALRRTATGRVVRLQATAEALAVDQGAPRRVTGVWVQLDEVESSAAGPQQRAGQALVTADAVVLATGGCGGLYAATTNRASTTGDGVALAWRAGATLVDCEFVQFHPTGLRSDAVTGAAEPGWRLLLTEALRGAGARLIDRDGTAFLSDHHPDGDLAPRHVVTRAILDQPDGAWLDARPLGADRLAEEFPTVLAGARQVGVDLVTQPAPVEPTQHYMVGGVATDLWGATTMPGLWAVGEVASTGVHGANRLAGNSLAQACVFGHRAATAIGSWLTACQGLARAEPSEPQLPTPPPAGGEPETLAALRATAREAMSVGAGPLRSADGLEACDKTLVSLAEQRSPAAPPTRLAVELDAALTVGRLIVRSARLRRESRGVHLREDAPERDSSWAGARLRLRREADL